MQCSKMISDMCIPINIIRDYNRSHRSSMGRTCFLRINRGTHALNPTKQFKNILPIKSIGKELERGQTNEILSDANVVSREIV